MDREYLEYRDGKSAKFWEASLEGSAIKLKWGKIGAVGSEKTLEFGSDTEAQDEFVSKIEQKIKSKYQPSFKSLTLNYAEDFQELLAKADVDLIKNTSEQIQKIIASNSVSNPLDLDVLSWSQSESVRWLVAENPNTSTTTLLRLFVQGMGRFKMMEGDESFFSTDSISSVVSQRSGKMAFAAYHKTPEDILDSLSREAEEWVRVRVARNESTGASTLQGLADDNSKEVIRGAIANPNCSSELIFKMSQSEDADILDGIADNPSTPDDILRGILFSGEDKLQAGFVPMQTNMYSNRRLQSVAENPNASHNILMSIKDSHDIVARRNVALNINCSVEILEELAKDPAEIVRAAVAASPKVSESTLASLACGKGDIVKAAVASNPKSPVELLQILSKERYLHTKWALAKRSDLPGDILESLAFDKNQNVASAAINNPKLPRNVLQKLKTTEKINPRIMAEVLVLLDEDDTWELVSKLNVAGKRAAASHPASSSRVIDALAKDKKKEIVELALKHPKCSNELKMSLSNLYHYSDNV